MKNSAHKKPVYLELQRNWAALYFKDWNYRKCQKIEVMTKNQTISDKIFLSRVKKSFKIGQG